MLTLKERLKLCIAILRFKPGNLTAHFERELPSVMNHGVVDELQTIMNRNLLELEMVFSIQGHSGFSASYAIPTFAKLADFDIIRPLTGKDEEWGECSLGGHLQNKRYSSVFKREDGQAYDINGIVWMDKVGGYTNQYSFVDITFPYIPKTEYRSCEEDPGRQDGEVEDIYAAAD